MGLIEKGEIQELGQIRLDCNSLHTDDNIRDSLSLLNIDLMGGLASTSEGVFCDESIEDQTSICTAALAKLSRRYGSGSC